MKKYSNKTFDALALFSGGLDSILAARLIQEQGLRVLGLHFVSPFFGHPDKLKEWEKLYGIPLMDVDISVSFVDMLLRGPAHGLGKTLNPCVDCKIIMLTKARQMLEDFGAKFIISGEVPGQRPMSQRLDTLNVIRRDSGVKEILVRALSARRFPPTDPEKKGLIDREKLGDLSGRGRKEQLRLARKYNINPIPTPGGGCLLTEKESARRYLPLFRYMHKPGPEDFHLANTGRQFWNHDHWLCVGRDKNDNQALEKLAGNNDYLFKLALFPGPLALGRPAGGREWPPEIIESACELVSRFSPKARQSSRQVDVRISRGKTSSEILVWPGEIENPTQWLEPEWDREAAKKIEKGDEHQSHDMV